MNTVNWSTYKFRCSSLPDLMTTSRKKDEVLSETAKSTLDEVFIREVYGREKSDTIANKYMQKGIMCETDSLELVERLTGKKYFKNLKQLENDFVKGTPDVVTPDVVDIKTSWDIFTFKSVKEDKARKDYYYQLLGYMYLTGAKESHLMYCLVDTPELLANDELYRMSFKIPETEVEKYKNNYTFGDIPEIKRVKNYHFEYSESDIELLKTKLLAAREYLANSDL